MYKGTEQGVEITRRFFEALDYLIDNKELRGVQTFTKRYNINKWNLLTLRKDPTNRILKPEYISYLVADYGISADWILTGRGEICEKP